MPNIFDNDFKKKLQQTMMESSSGNSNDPGLYFGGVTKMHYGMAKSSGNYHLMFQVRATQRGRTPVDGLSTVYMTTTPNLYADETKQLKRIFTFLDTLKSGIEINIDSINSHEDISNLVDKIFEVIKDWELSFEVVATKNPNFPKLVVKEVYPSTKSGDVKF